MEKNFEKLFINKNSSIITCLNQMDSIDRKLLIVNENSKVHGLISIGDVQRAILKGIDLNKPINNILRTNFKIGNDNENFESVKLKMIQYRMEFYPIVNGKNELVECYFWEDLFQESMEPIKQFDKSIVIMAGGFGTRMRPLTNVIPKPLIPLSEKSIIEDIIDSFIFHGSRNFHISINYKGSLLKYYLDDQKSIENITYYEENKPLGTAGSIALMKDNLTDTFFVSNCDILIRHDYSEILDYHENSRNKITLVSAIKSYDIPYGTLETGKNGQLINLNEKPKINFQINSGMYLLEKEILDLIPDDEFFHITQLIEKVIENKGKVGVYPLNESSWLDIGTWDEYLQKLKIIKK